MTYYTAKEVRLARKGESLTAKVSAAGYARVQLEETSFIVRSTDCELVIVPVSMLRRLGWAPKRKK